MANDYLRMNRRRFLGGAAMAAAAGVLGGFPAGAPDVMAAPRRQGSLDDVKHVVVLMQENRSFDHYYGTMRGVRGFSDRTARQLPSGRSVFYQPDAQRHGYLLPFRVDTDKVDSQDLGDLAHDWNSTHMAWSGGQYDQWVAAKSEMTMAYFDRGDIPFHRALAEAYTVCDNYHCSIMGPTTPNRLFMWTGTIDPQGVAGGPATWNPADYQPDYSWTTYPERLQAAGVSWQVYANDEVGDNLGYPFAGDYGDNPLWLFDAYHAALASNDPKVHQLAERGGLVKAWKPYSGKGLDVDHVIARFRRDCAAGTLPAVSWVVAPYGYSEHPAARPVDGQAYVQGVLDALWGNPELLESTVLLINFDENDGFFDHLPPPVPPPGTPDEFLPAVQPIFDGIPPPSGPPTAIGLGPRVPMTVVSPWSRGGWVNSQVFDHTSVIRFLETWTGVYEPNISAWRRAICGDLTSCFDFAAPNTTIPVLPDTAAMRRRANRIDPTLPPAAPPKGQQAAPVQEPGKAQARPLPYQPLANFEVEAGQLHFTMTNAGAATVALAVYANHLGAAGNVQNLDVAPGYSAGGSVALDPVTSAYDVWAHGPNGFLARASGDRGGNLLAVEAALALTGSPSHPALELTAINRGATAVTAQVTNLEGEVAVLDLPAHGGTGILRYDPLGGAHGWYDLTLTLKQDSTYLRRYAGHLENGQPSLTG